MVLLTCQFFLVYVVWFVVQVLNRLNILRREAEEKILVAIVDTVFFVPMLCVLIFATKIRAFQLSQGHSFDLPQWWAKLGMIVCTWSVLLWTVTVFLARTVFGDQWEMSAYAPTGFGFAKVLHVLRNTALFAIYAGFSTICVGVITMQGPAEVWGKRGGPRISPAVICTIILTTMYFLVYLCLAGARQFSQVTAQAYRFNALVKTSLAFVPMLCLLFIAARLRALQIDPVHGNPRTWTQAFFFVCTFSVIIQAALFVFEAFSNAKKSQGDSMTVTKSQERSIEFMGDSKRLDSCKLSLTVVVHLSLIPIFCGIYFSRTPSGGSPPPLPPSIRSTCWLQVVYFFVHSVSLLASTVQDSRQTAAGATSGQVWDLRTGIEVFLRVRAKEAVAFCPMFCILFLGMMMEAKQIGGPYASPPQWCINCQYVVVFSILALALSRVDGALPRPQPLSQLPQVPPSGGRMMLAGAHISQTESWIRWLCPILQYVFLVVLYGCALLLSVALCSMTGSSRSPSAFQPVVDGTSFRFG